MEIVAGHPSPVTGPSAHAAGPVASIKSENTCSNSLLRTQLEMEARVGIGLRKADFWCEISLISLAIQHFC